MRILLIEDNEDHALLISDAMSDEHELETVGCLLDALEHAEVTEWDVIICDLSLPDSTGIDNVRQLRKVAPDVPLVVLTCLDDECVALEALDAGAQDYLVKTEILLASATTKVALDHAIRYAIRRQQNVSELRESHRLLEKKNERLAELCETAQRFVDNVSHEFRTPLTVIKDYASLVRDGIVGEVNDEQRRMLGVIDDRSDDLNTMVDDMLDVSKLEAGLLGVHRNSGEVADIIHRVLPSLEQKATVRNVSLEIVLPDDLPSVCCDAEKIGRVLINLVSNAMKFSGEPGEVLLSAKQDDESHEVLITVHDNGPGIPEDKLGEIFERFKQPVTSLRQSTKGFGLGLGIAKELVDLNLGRMKVVSTEGKGSSFMFSIPYAEPSEVARRLLQRIRQREDESATVCFLELESSKIDTERDLTALGIFIEQRLRPNDQLFSVDGSRWVGMLNLSTIDFSLFCDRMRQEHYDVSRNRPLGPLPELIIRERGSWCLAEHDDATLIAAFEICLDTQDACHV